MTHTCLVEQILDQRSNNSHTFPAPEMVCFQYAKSLRIFSSRTFLTEANMEASYIIRNILKFGLFVLFIYEMVLSILELFSMKTNVTFDYNLDSVRLPSFTFCPYYVVQELYTDIRPGKNMTLLDLMTKVDSFKQEIVDVVFYMSDDELGAEDPENM